MRSVRYSNTIKNFFTGGPSETPNPEVDKTNKSVGQLPRINKEQNEIQEESVKLQRETILSALSSPP